MKARVEGAHSYCAAYLPTQLFEKTLVELVETTVWYSGRFKIPFRVVTIHVKFCKNRGAVS